MNTSAEILTGLLVFTLILIFWESERFLTATLAALGVFLSLVIINGKGKD